MFTGVDNGLSIWFGGSKWSLGVYGTGGTGKELYHGPAQEGSLSMVPSTSGWVTKTAAGPPTALIWNDPAASRKTAPAATAATDFAVAEYKTLSSGTWQNSTVMASDSSSLYVVCGTMGGCSGGGGLYKVSKADGSHKHLSGTWDNATVMASDGSSLFIVDGKMGGCSGAGKLYKVSTTDGSYKQLGGNGAWNNATVMASDGSSLYVVCGKIGGCTGGGGVYKVSTADGAYKKLGISGNWQNATVMAATSSGLFMASGILQSSTSGTILIPSFFFWGAGQIICLYISLSCSPTALFMPALHCTHITFALH